MSGRGQTRLVAMLARAWTNCARLQAIHRLAMVVTGEGDYARRQDHDAKRVSDPAAVQKSGRAKAEQFFKAISGLVRLSRVGPGDHCIAAITIATDGKSARVQTQIRLGGKWQPPGTEVWTLVDGTWCYQETVKK